MIAVDTSVVVAGFASWHEGHASSSAALARKPRLPAHVLIESYSVLTRLPAPHRAAAAIVRIFLAERFPGTLLAPSGLAYREILDNAAAAGVTGGAIYDALIAATVKHAGATLVTRDRRALATYEKFGVRYEVLE